MTPGKLIRIPTVFFDDHDERELPTPKVVKRTKTHIWVDASDPNLPELKDDASFYAHPDGPDEISFGLKSSARATAKALKDAGIP